MKQFNDLTAVEKTIIREYNAWRNSDCEVGLKYEMLTQWRNRAMECEIDHLL